MTDEQLSDWLADQGVSGLAMNGYADCFIGYSTEVEVMDDVTLVYDYHKVIRKLMGMGMSEEEAVDFHNYNQTTGQVQFVVVPAPEDGA